MFTRTPKKQRLEDIGNNCGIIYMTKVLKITVDLFVN